MYSLFWLWRSIWQVTYLRPSKIKVIKSTIIRHYILLFVFILLCICYVIPCISSVRLYVEQIQLDTRLVM
jgi:hypothetical protein